MCTCVHTTLIYTQHIQRHSNDRRLGLARSTLLLLSPKSDATGSSRNRKTSGEPQGSVNGEKDPSLWGNTTCLLGELLRGPAWGSIIETQRHLCSTKLLTCLLGQSLSNPSNSTRPPCPAPVWLLSLCPHSSSQLFSYQKPHSFLITKKH